MRPLPQALALITTVIASQTGTLTSGEMAGQVNMLIDEMCEQERYDIIVTFAAMMGETLRKNAELRGEPIEHALHRLGLIVNAPHDEQ